MLPVVIMLFLFAYACSAYAPLLSLLLSTFGFALLMVCGARSQESK